VTLHYRVDGPEGAQVLVLGSSLGTSLEMWEPQVSRLSGALRLLRYDRRGHGASPPQSGAATIDDLGADVLSLLDELALEQVSFCGLSLGGVEGMWLAANAPGRLDRLACCCTAPVFEPKQQWLDRAETVRTSGLAAIADAVVTRWFGPAFQAAHPEIVDRFREELVAVDPGSYAACCEALAGADLRPFLRRITAPTLVLTGADDPVVSPAAGDALAAAIAGASHVVVDAAAHIANVEQPDRVTAALLAHFTVTDEEAR
jgi:3-oxoadipate enol-lactonase